MMIVPQTSSNQVSMRIVCAIPNPPDFAIYLIGIEKQGMCVCVNIV